MSKTEDLIKILRQAGINLISAVVEGDNGFAYIRDQRTIGSGVPEELRYVLQDCLIRFASQEAGFHTDCSGAVTAIDLDLENLEARWSTLDRHYQSRARVNSGAVSLAGYNR